MRYVLSDTLCDRQSMGRGGSRQVKHYNDHGHPQQVQSIKPQSINTFVNWSQSEEGMLPVNCGLKLNHNDFSRVNSEIEGGMLPVNALL